MKNLPRFESFEYAWILEAIKDQNYKNPKLFYILGHHNTILFHHEESKKPSGNNQLSPATFCSVPKRRDLKIPGSP
jgi:hypothetical protein